MKIGPIEANDDDMKLFYYQTNENKVITYIPFTLSKVVKDNILIIYADNILTHMSPCVLSIRAHAVDVDFFFFFSLKGYWLREKKITYKKNPACRQTL